MNMMNVRVYILYWLKVYFSSGMIKMSLYVVLFSEIIQLF